MDYIKLKERKDIFKLGIQDEEGNIVYDNEGKEVCIEFNLGDINLPLNYNRCLNKVKEAKQKLKTQFILIDKKQDKKGKQLLSYNEQQKVKSIKEFYKDMEEAMDIFLGEGGTKKFLNGREMYWEIWDDIDEALRPFLPKMKVTVNDMESRIKEKYKIKESEGEVLRDV